MMELMVFRFGMFKCIVTYSSLYTCHIGRNTLFTGSLQKTNNTYMAQYKY